MSPGEPKGGPVEQGLVVDGKIVICSDCSSPIPGRHYEESCVKKQPLRESLEPEVCSDCGVRTIKVSVRGACYRCEQEHQDFYDDIDRRNEEGRRYL